tara:strand:- start:2087 stop:2974 length:888 start_codon:yes stop_codon:yes gene_type:complete
LSKNTLAYSLLVTATFVWSANFIVGKLSTLFQVPPLTLNFYRWVLVWFLILPFTYKEILTKRLKIKKNIGLLIILGITGVSVFNSVVYFALNFTQVINAVLMISIIPVIVIFLSSILKIEKFNLFQLLGLIVSLTGVLAIIFQADLNKILSLVFNKGDLWMLVAVLSWATYSTLLKKRKLPFKGLSLLQILITIGLFFLLPQYLGEHFIGKEVTFNKAFFLILAFVAIFPSIFAFYAWNKSIELIGANRASIFLHLMPLFGAIMAVVIFNEKFEMYHFIGAGFIVTGIYLSNRKT